MQRHGPSATIAGSADRIEADFCRWADFDTSACVACHAAPGLVEPTPIADAAQFGFKSVNGHPGNPPLGLPTVMAFGVLADMATGAPRLLAEPTLATAIRSAATSALVARRLARPRSRLMAPIGNGAQAAFQAIAFRDLVGVTTLRLFDADPRATARLVANLAGSGLTLQLCRSNAVAVHGTDIVATVTADKTNATILTPDMLQPGLHSDALGGGCPGKTELHPGVLQAAGVFVEHAPQSRIEGDVRQMPADFPVTALWQLLTGAHPGRRGAAG